MEVTVRLLWERTINWGKDIKMAYMSPDMYRGVLEKAKGLVNRAKTYLDGSIIPIVFKSELEEMILECESTKANLSTAIKCLKSGSPNEPRYQDALNETYNVQRELQYYKDKLFNQKARAESILSENAL